MGRLFHFIGMVTTEMTYFLKDPVFVIVVPILCLSIVFERCGVSL